MGYVKLVGHAKRHEIGTSEIVLEKDENGNVSKSVKAGIPAELSADEQKKLEAQGFIFEDSSADEAKKVAAETPMVGSDIAGSAPVFGSTAVPEATDQPASDKPKGK